LLLLRFQDEDPISFYARCSCLGHPAGRCKRTSSHVSLIPEAKDIEYMLTTPLGMA
jgi:hypothetical protein